MIRHALVASALATLVLAALAGPACIVPTISQNDAGTATAATGSTDGGTTTSADGAVTTTVPVVTGGTCTAITSTISLCQTISSCPGLALNPQVFPQCGFRIHGDAIDPECFCQSEYLCPIAVPTTCSEAAIDTTGDVTYDSVCAKAVTNGCTDLTASSGASTACQECAAACNNVPACVEACGC